MSRQLPNLHALRAFEAAARLGGFKLAAEELNVSPTAISHHIRNLEARLKVPLFIRETRRVVLTEEGQRLLRSCWKAFDLISESVEQLTSERTRQTITIALSPSFARRWFLPRLPKFRERFPAEDVRLLHSRGDQLDKTADLQIGWGSRMWEGVDTMPMLTVVGSPVASPDVLRRMEPISDPSALLNQPILAHRDRGEWLKWLHNNGVDVPTSTFGTIADDENLIIRATIEGNGIAIGWFPLMNKEIEAGSLVRILPKDVPNHGEYKLLIRRSGHRSDKMIEIADWLLEEGSATSSEQSAFRPSAM